MVTKKNRFLPFGGGIFLGLALLGCSGGVDNSPSMGAVPPKPNPNMNAQLPAEVRDQIAKAKPGSDASKMSAMKPHGASQ